MYSAALVRSFVRIHRSPVSRRVASRRVASRRVASRRVASLAHPCSARSAGSVIVLNATSRSAARRSQTRPVAILRELHARHRSRLSIAARVTSTTMESTSATRCVYYYCVTRPPLATCRPLRDGVCYAAPQLTARAVATHHCIPQVMGRQPATVRRLLPAACCPPHLVGTENAGKARATS